MTACPQCERGWQHGAGELHPVGSAVLEQAQCDADVIRGSKDGRSRISRTIPPSVRREVMLRDHHRCIVPGCRNSEHLEVHHLWPRARGGGNRVDNLEGRPGAFEFEHDDGRPWGTPPPEPGSSTSEPACLGDLRLALRGMGIKLGDANHAIPRAATHVCHDAPIEEWLAAALREYRPGR